MERKISDCAPSMARARTVYLVGAAGVSEAPMHRAPLAKTNTAAHLKCGQKKGAGILVYFGPVIPVGDGTAPIRGPNLPLPIRRGMY